MSVNRKLVFLSFLWKFIERSIVQIVSFIVTIILARLLTPEDYGSIAIVLVFISLATVFIEGGLSTALIQKKECDNIDYSTIFYFSLLVALVVYSVLFFSAGTIADFYDKPELCSVIRVIGISLFFNAINSVQNAYLSKKMLFKKMFYSSFIGVCISAVIGITLAYNGGGVWALVMQQVVSSFSIMLVMWFTVKWRPVWAFSKGRFKTLFDYGWKIFLSNLTISVFANIRILIIGKIYSASSLAFYDKGRQFPTLVMDNINTSIQSVMFPVLSTEQNNLTAVKSMMRRSTRVSSYVIYPLLVGLMIVAEPLTIALLTEKWRDTIPFIQIFCLSFMMMPIQNVNMVAIKAMGHSNISLKLELIKKVVGTIILILSVFGGVKAIAWGVVVYNFICIAINLYPSKKLLDYGYREQVLDVLPALLISLLMGGAIYWLKYLPFNPIVLLSIEVFSGVLIYMFLSIIFKLDSCRYILLLFKKKE